MLDLKLVQKQPEVLAKALRDRCSKLTIEEFQELDGRRRKLIAEVETLKGQRNKASQEVAKLKKEGGDASALLQELGELSARIKAVLRRYYAKDEKTDEETIKFENLEISKNKYELKLNGKAVDIPPKELELLYFLASNFNRVFTRDQLLDKVWGFDYLGDSRTVDVHVKRLREKLEGVSDKWSLKTVWGEGYKFELVQ